MTIHDRSKSFILSLFYSSFLFTAAFLVPFSPSSADDRIDWNDAEWTPLRNTVTIERDTAVTITESPNGSLRIRGTFSNGDASAVSDIHPMSEYQIYRITAHIRADRFEAKKPLPYSFIPVPYIRCEFLTDDPGGSLGYYDLRNIAWKWGQWHALTGEFRAPWGTRRCRLMLADNFESWLNGVKRDDITFDVDIHVDGIGIEPVERFDIENKYRTPRSTALDNMRGVHPRLFLTEARIHELRESVKTTHAALWRNVQTLSDNLIKSGPPEWRSSGPDVWDEQWWMANNGPSMVTLAMAYLMSGERRYFDAAREWALATCSYPGWGTGWAANVDCMTGHNIFGLALVCDWLYDDLSESDRRIIVDTVAERGGHMFEKAATGTIVPTHDDFAVRPWPEWEEAWLQNHLWVNATGLLTAGLAFYDVREETGRWITFAREKFPHSVSYFGPDGASHEGINYWSYGLEHLLESMHLMRDFLFVDLYKDDWFRNTALYRLHMSIPRNAWATGSTTVNYGDSHPRDSYGPDYMLRALAAEYRDPYAQHLARLLDEADVLNSHNRWLNLIWYDPAVPEKAPDDLPTLHHFEDQGIVTARSDWSGDESYLFYKCGPYIGYEAIDTMTYCASSAHHTHPDQNEFMLFGGGEWLMRDDGNYGKYTGQHNTLIIDGGEQLGGGDSIFDGSRLHALKRKPRIILAESAPDFDHIAGDAAEAYPPETGLRTFTRHLLLLKDENVLIVADDILLDTPRDLELRFHPGPQEAGQSGSAFFTRTEKSVMRFEPLTPEGADITAEKHDLVDRRYNKSDMLAFRLKKRGSSWQNVVAISWADAGKEPVIVTCDIRGDAYLFRAGSREVTFDRKTGTAKLFR